MIFGIDCRIPSHGGTALGRGTCCQTLVCRPGGCQLRSILTNHSSICKSYSSDEGPDWDEEMSIFKKRIVKPSQLAALRKIQEEKMEIGKVRWIPDVPVLEMLLL